jgi:hypothetical protein
MSGSENRKRHVSGARIRRTYNLVAAVPVPPGTHMRAVPESSLPELLTVGEKFRQSLVAVAPLRTGTHMRAVPESSVPTHVQAWPDVTCGECRVFVDTSDIPPNVDDGPTPQRVGRHEWPCPNCSALLKAIPFKLAPLDTPDVDCCVAGMARTWARCSAEEVADWKRGNRMRLFAQRVDRVAKRFFCWIPVIVLLWWIWRQGLITAQTESAWDWDVMNIVALVLLSGFAGFFAFGFGTYIAAVIGEMTNPLNRRAAKRGQPLNAMPIRLRDELTPVADQWQESIHPQAEANTRAAGL